MCSISRIASRPSRPAKRNENSIRSHDALGLAGFLRGSAPSIDVLQRLRKVVFRLGQRGVGFETFVRVGQAGPVDDRLGELPHGRPNGKRRGAIVGRNQVVVRQPFELNRSSRISGNCLGGPSIGSIGPSAGRPSRVRNSLKSIWPGNRCRPVLQHQDGRQAAERDKPRRRQRRAASGRREPLVSTPATVENRLAPMLLDQARN